MKWHTQSDGEISGEKQKWPKTSNKQRQSDKEAMRWNNEQKVKENNGEMKNALKASNKQRQSDEHIRENKMK